MLRLTFKKVEDEYKEWIESAGNDKLKLVEEYEQRLKESHKIAAALSTSSHSS